MASEPPRTILRFGGFRLDLGRSALLGPSGAEVPLRPKAFDVLRHLVENAGRLVPRDELLGAVWAEVFVTDDNVTQCVAEVRRALGQDASRLLRTVQRRGYLFEAEVSHEEARSQAAPEQESGSIASAEARGATTAGRTRLAVLDRPSLVVLPFRNMGGNPEQEYFADGMTEELTTALSQARWFPVVARNSAFAYKGRAVDVREVGRELGVQYVLEGGVRSAGGCVRITAQLIETGTGRHVWTDRFDGTLDDVFGLQDRVAETVAGMVEPSLRVAELARSRAKPTGSLDAYDLYLRALPHHHAVTREGSEEALALLRRAAALDPDFAAAKALAAFCQGVRSLQGWAVPGDEEEGIRLAREALAAGMDDPRVLQHAARVLGLLAFDRDAAVAAVERSLALNPHSAEAHQAAGYVNNWLCRPEAALRHFERAARLSPLDPEMVHVLTGSAVAHLIAGRYEAALDAARQALRLQPEWGDAHRNVVAALWLLGRREEAAAAALRAREIAPTAARTFADRTRRLFADQAFVEARTQAVLEAGLPH